MGTRAQVCVVDGKEKIYLYQHYDGYELPNTVRRALQRGTDRWNDMEYLSRIIFCEMLAFQPWWENVRGKPPMGDGMDDGEDVQRIREYQKDIASEILTQTTGYGIGVSEHGDIEYLVTVDVFARGVKVEHNGELVGSYTFEQFIKDKQDNWE